MDFLVELKKNMQIEQMQIYSDQNNQIHQNGMNGINAPGMQPDIINTNECNIEDTDDFDVIEMIPSPTTPISSRLQKYMESIPSPASQTNSRLEKYMKSIGVELSNGVGNTITKNYDSGDNKVNLDSHFLYLHRFHKSSWTNHGDI